MDKLRTLARKATVVLRALPTYLALVVTALTIFQEEIVGLFPEAWGGDVTGFIALVIVWIGAVVATIRRLTPAVEGTFGLLPPEQPDVADADA